MRWLSAFILSGVIYGGFIYGGLIYAGPVGLFNAHRSGDPLDWTHALVMGGVSGAFMMGLLYWYQNRKREKAE
ncbi:hypothetical protein [uncultured Algimonas sp.]|uniref:hypothetical protein n=1 Tax=uncultured Algimonas sp. TaxID=1547920 RepID=UPI002638F4EB|nr:hypothetical protein [uncultured Algimonas sp.]